MDLKEEVEENKLTVRRKRKRFDFLEFISHTEIYSKTGKSVAPRIRNIGNRCRNGDVAIIFDD